MTWRSVWSGAFLICVVGCGGDPGSDPDGGTGFDTPDGAGFDAPDACSPPPSVTCAYQGYGTPCLVACALPETCAFDVTVGWNGGYCCGGGGGVGSEMFFDCRCVGGTVRCPRFPGSTDRTTPTTTCEFCETLDAGPPDAHDAGG